MVCIRKAKLADAPILIRLTDQLGYRMTLPALVANLKAYLQDSDRSIFVAAIKGDVVGFIALDVAQTFHREGKHMRIVSLVVDQSYRGKGIGKLLLQAAEDWAKQQSCWVIEVTSSFRRQKEGVHDFYVNQGYLKKGSQYFNKLMDSF